MAKIYVADLNGQKTEYEEEQLSQLWGQGLLRSDWLYWKEGMAKWEPVKSLFEVSPPSVDFPPIPIAEASWEAMTLVDGIEYSDDEIRIIAKRQKVFLWFFLSIILVVVVPYLALPFLITYAVFFYKIAVSLKYKRAWLYAISAFFLLLNLLVLSRLSAQCSKILKARGLKVGVMGASKSEIASLTR